MHRSAVVLRSYVLVPVMISSGVELLGEAESFGIRFLIDEPDDQHRKISGDV
jgi:hypothetical protein